jgi:hypothetical protein
MKKKKLKNLSLKKSSISNLNGGAAAPAPVSLALPCQPITLDLINCTWVSELYTACYCEPSWHGGCGPSINIPCPGTVDLACGLESVRICVA